MCGLPTETDEDVLADRRPRQARHRQGPRGLGPQRHPLHRLDRWVRAQAAHAVPVGRAARPRHHRRAAAQAARHRARRQEVRPGDRLPLPRRQARHRSRDCCLAGDRRVGSVIEQVWRDGGRFDGWSEHFSYDRWVTAAADALRRHRASTSPGSPRASASTTRCCPWDHLDSGLDKDWLWADWEDALAVADDPDSASRSRTAAGRPATTAASAPRWRPRSRSARPAGSCCRSPSSDPGCGGYSGAVSLEPSTL